MHPGAVRFADRRFQIRCDVAPVANSVATTEDSNVDFDTEISWDCRLGFRERLSGTHRESFTETCTTGATLGQSSSCDQVSCDAHNDARIINCHRNFHRIPLTHTTLCRRCRFDALW